MRRVCFAAMLAAVAVSKVGYGQTGLKTPLALTSIPGISSSWPGEGAAGCSSGVIVNTSVVARSNTYHSVILTSGSGTWSATINYSDTACSGPWTSFGSTAVITQASNPAIAFGNGYHSWVQIVVTGNAVVMYAGQNQLPLSTSVGSVSFPVSIAQGGTNASTSVAALANLLQGNAQGTYTNKIQMAGTNSGSNGSPLCNDASGNATTSGCAPSLPAGSQLQQLQIQPNTGNVTTYQWASKPVIITPDYSFPSQSPSGSITAGVNATVTVTPVPLGVSWNDAPVGANTHWLWVAGTGTPEACYIVSAGPGTATSGSASGTLTIHCPGSHGAGFTLGPASGGLQEAAMVAPFQGGVFVPPGTTTLNAPVGFGNAQILFGSPGPLVSWLATTFTANDVIVMNGGGSVGGIHDLRITNSGTPRASGSTVHIVDKSTAFVDNVMILDAFIGLELENWQGHVANVWIATANTIGATRAIYAHATGINVTGGTMSDLTLGIAGTLGYGLFIQGGDAGLQVTNLSSQGGAAAVALNPNGLALNEILFTNLIMDGYAQAGFLAVGSTGSSNGITIVGARYSSPAANSIAFQFNSLYSHVKISEANGASVLYDVDLMGTKSVDITNNRFASNGAGGNTNIFIETDGGVTASDILIADNSMGFAPGGGTTNPPVFSISVTANAHDRIDVHGNTLRSALNWLSTGTYNIIRNNFDFSMTQPTCSSTLRGSLWYTASASGTTDLFNACVKTGADAYTWVQQINQTKGADITSANTITLTDRIHKVTGTTTIKTMNVPAGCIVTCQVTIIPTGALPWDNTGNISKPAATATANLAVVFTWVAADSKWY